LLKLELSRSSLIARFPLHRLIGHGHHPVVELDLEDGNRTASSRLVTGRPSSSRAMANPRRSVACGPRPTTIRVLASISFRAASMSDPAPTGDGGEVALQSLSGPGDQPRRIPARLGLEMVQVTARSLEARLGLEGDGLGQAFDLRPMSAEVHLRPLGDGLGEPSQAESRLAERVLGPGDHLLVTLP
jgi:hypothetical protein